MIFGTVRSKKENYSAIVSQPFLLKIYTEQYILIGFSYSSKPVDFRVLSMSFLNFLSLVSFQGQRLFETEFIK